MGQGIVSGRQFLWGAGLPKGNGDMQKFIQSGPFNYFFISTQLSKEKANRLLALFELPGIIRIPKTDCLMGFQRL